MSQTVEINLSPEHDRSLGVPYAGQAVRQGKVGHLKVL